MVGYLILFALWSFKICKLCFTSNPFLTPVNIQTTKASQSRQEDDDDEDDEDDGDDDEDGGDDL